MTIDVEAGELVVKGRALRRGDDGFDEAALPWNLAVRHSPDLLLEAADADDVIAGMRWASERSLPVAVQSTGHGATEAVRDGLLISTRRLDGIEVDVAGRTARVGAGVRWSALLAQTVPHGLIGLCGSSTDVGIAGYCLGGGLPAVGRAFGFASDHIRSIDVVTPDGRLRTVDAEHEPDLFTALRGGKGEFGIVTALELELLPVQRFYGGGIFYPGEDAAMVLTAFREWVAELPDEACPSVALLRLPPLEFVPEPLRGRFVVHLRFAFVGDADEGDRLLAPMRALSRPILDTAGAMSYAQIDQVSQDPQEPVPFAMHGTLLHAFDAAAQAALLEVAGPDVRTPLLMVELRALGGALARPPRTADAVAGRDAAFLIDALGLLVPPMADAVPTAIEGVLNAIRPWSTGYSPVNFSLQPGPHDAAGLWTPQGYDAVVRAKRRYDPNDSMRSGLQLGRQDG